MFPIFCNLTVTDIISPTAALDCEDSADRILRSGALSINWSTCSLLSQFGGKLSGSPSLFSSSVQESSHCGVSSKSPPFIAEPWEDVAFIPIILSLREASSLTEMMATNWMVVKAAISGKVTVFVVER